MDNFKVQDNRITVSGSLTVDTVPQLYQKPLNLKEGHHLVDLHEVDDIDSSGMVLLLYWWSRSSRQGARLEFQNCPEKLKQIAGISGLEAVFGPSASLE